MPPLQEHNKQPKQLPWFKKSGKEIYIREDQCLKNDANRVLSAFMNLENEQTVLAIGHQFDISYAVDRLTNTHYSPNHAEAVVIRVEQDNWKNVARTMDFYKIAHKFKPQPI